MVGAVELIRYVSNNDASQTLCCWADCNVSRAMAPRIGSSTALLFIGFPLPFPLPPVAVVPEESVASANASRCFLLFLSVVEDAAPAAPAVLSCHPVVVAALPLVSTGTYDVVLRVQLKILILGVAEGDACAFAGCSAKCSCTIRGRPHIAGPLLSSPPVKFDSAVRAAVSRTVAS